MSSVKTIESVALATVLSRNDSLEGSQPTAAPSRAQEIRSPEYQEKLSSIMRAHGIDEYKIATAENAPVIFRALGDIESAADKYLPEWKKPRVEVVLVESLRGNTPAAYLADTSLPGRDGILFVAPGVSSSDYAATRFVVGHEYGHGMLHVNKDNLEQLKANPCFSMPALANHIESLKGFVLSQPNIPEELKPHILQQATQRQVTELSADRLSVLMTRDARTPTAYFTGDPEIPLSFEGYYAKRQKENRESEPPLSASATSYEIDARESFIRVDALTRLHIPLPARLEMLTPPQQCMGENPAALPTPSGDNAGSAKKPLR